MLPDNGVKKRVWWIIGGFAAILLAAAVLVLLYRPPVEIELLISGTPGMRVTGEYSADGRRYPIDAAVPTRIAVRAGDARFHVAKVSEDDDLRVVVRVDGQTLHETRERGPRHGVRGGVTSRLRSRSTWMGYDD